MLNLLELCVCMCSFFWIKKSFSKNLIKITNLIHLESIEILHAFEIIEFNFSQLVRVRGEFVWNHCFLFVCLLRMKTTHKWFKCHDKSKENYEKKMVWLVWSKLNSMRINEFHDKCCFATRGNLFEWTFEVDVMETNEIPLVKTRWLAVKSSDQTPNPQRKKTTSKQIAF